MLLYFFVRYAKENRLFVEVQNDANTPVKLELLSHEMITSELMTATMNKLEHDRFLTRCTKFLLNLYLLILKKPIRSNKHICSTLRYSI